jgi:hypothetical protein
MSDTDIEGRLFPTVPEDRKVPMPDFKAIHTELIGHKHVTLEPSVPIMLRHLTPVILV